MVRMQVICEVRDAIIERVVMNRVRGGEKRKELKQYIKEETTAVLDEIEEEFYDSVDWLYEDIMNEYSYKIRGE